MPFATCNLFCILSKATTANSISDSSIAPGNSHTSNNATTELSAEPAEKPDTMLRTRFLQSWDPQWQPTTAKKTTAEKTTAENTTAEKPEQRKKPVFIDLKHFTTKLKLGPRVLAFQMHKNDTGETSSVTHSVTHSATPSVTHSATQSATDSVVILPTSEEIAFRRVLGTTELLERIICYLLMKKIIDVQRVSRQWKNVIAGSPSIQKKLFKRRENKEQEIWVLVKRNPMRGRIRDKLQRVPVPPPPGRWVITPVTLNPMLHEARTWLAPNALAFPVSMLPNLVSVHFSAWANALQYEESCVRDMFITDPPCTKIHIKYLIVYLGFPETRFQRPKPDYFDQNHPKQDALSVRISDVTAESASGLTMRDIFRAALHSRGDARLTLSGGWEHDRADTTLYEMIEFLMKIFGWTIFPESPYMELCMGLATLGCSSIIIATEAEREIANEQLMYRVKPAHKF